MALTQSARLPGPSWDEEVVPALRKRLETESRTLARRMSAISLSSMDDSPPAGFSSFPDAAPRDSAGATSTHRQDSVGSTRLRTGYQQSNAANNMMPSSSHRVNGANPANKPTATSFQRSRTYSQPYAPNLSNNEVLQPKVAGKSADPSRSLSPRPSDIKPTRIPVASRSPPVGSYTNGSSPSIPYTNGYSYPATAAVTTSAQEPSQNPDSRPTQSIPNNTSRSAVSAPPRQTYRIINEPPPFQPGSITSSVASSTNGHDAYDDTPPRPSNDSEERPFEHWYRGDTSRNGGVGELRVARRQEMLEIANYGHTIGNRNKSSSIRTQGMGGVADDYQRRRKRADSIAGLTNKERERGSVYLDDERAEAVGRVLDENPLTDLDGEEVSEVESTSEYYPAENGYDDVFAAPHAIEEPIPQTHSQTQLRQAYEARSTTPTAFHRPSSRQQQQQNAPAPTRIPGPSSRRSSESRVATPTQYTRGQSEPPSFPSTSASASMSSPVLPASSSSLQGKKPAGQKRGASPAAASASKKSRTSAGKATRDKKAAARREMEEDEKRRSVAQYPTPGDGEDMADAIPSWTQPVPRQGNWDDVVLPVVARKKGLDGQYERADGSPQQKKVNNVIEPAPGTFGYDHSKYRPPRTDEYIPMDEFGRPTSRIEEEPTSDTPSEPDSKSRTQPLPSKHDQTRLPVRHPPTPSQAPFSQYAPSAEKIPTPPVPQSRRTDFEQGRQEEEVEKAGCCSSCVIM